MKAVAPPHGMFVHHVCEVASLRTGDFHREILPELGTPRDYLWRRAECFLTAAGIERTIALLCARQKTGAALAIREAWFEAQLSAEVYS